MTELVHVGELMTRDELAGLLIDTAHDIRRGNSDEGFIEYLLPEDSNDILEEKISVRAKLRTGNLQGQGRMLIIGKFVEKSDN